MELYKSAQAYAKHIERVFDRVSWYGQEALLMQSDSDMFKGWSKTDSTQYNVGNVFRRSVNGVAVKFLTLVKPTQQYAEPWDAPEVFRPVQFSFDSDLKPIVCKWVENEYLIRNCRRICPVDGKTYWYKFDSGVASVAPSVARAANPKEWGEV